MTPQELQALIAENNQKAKEIFKLAIEKTDKTDYNVWVDFAPHVNCINVYVKRKKAEKRLFAEGMIYLNQKGQFADIYTTKAAEKLNNCIEFINNLE